MENPRPAKVAVVDEVREHLDSSSAAILTEYRGLKVKDLAGLRRSLREAGGEYKIYKNTLVRFAARDLGLADLEPMLTGPTAIAFVTGDAANVAKALRDFARTNPNLVVKGGVLGNRVLSAGDAGALADLPSREVLLARLAGALAAPMVQFAGLLQALPRNFAYGLQALIDQKGGLPATPEPVADPEPEAAPEPVADSGEAGGDGPPPARDEPSGEEPTNTAGGDGPPPARDEPSGEEPTNTAGGDGPPPARDEPSGEEPTNTAEDTVPALPDQPLSPNPEQPESESPTTTESE